MKEIKETCKKPINYRKHPESYQLKYEEDEKEKNSFYDKIEDKVSKDAITEKGLSKFCKQNLGYSSNSYNQELTNKKPILIKTRT